MPPSRQGGLSRRGAAGDRMSHVLDLGWTLPLTVVPCTARFVGPNYNMQGGLAPDVVGGEFCLAAVSFLSPFGRPLGAGGGEAPGSRSVHGS